MTSESELTAEGRNDCFEVDPPGYGRRTQRDTLRELEQYFLRADGLVLLHVRVWFVGSV